MALPLARPALAAGAALAVMEALADFGAVNLLNYRAMTDAIYRVWYGAFDQAAALQLATILLVGLSLALIVLERLLRGRARYHGALARGEAVVPRRLRGAARRCSRPRCRAAARCSCSWGRWSSSSCGRSSRWARAPAPATSRATRSRASRWPAIAALIAAGTATVVVYGRAHAPVAARRA